LKLPRKLGGDNQQTDSRRETPDRLEVVAKTAAVQFTTVAA
jgi:hypothetical protein